MATSAEIKKKLEKVFDERQATVLAEVFVDAYGELVKASDFDGLKAIVKELAEAQTRTEEALQKLTEEQGEARKQLGGISMTIGYTLENEAFKALPGLLQRDFGIIVRGKPKRKYVTDNKGKSIEVNIIGEATKEGKEIVIVGETKSQLSKNDVDSFVRRKLNRLEGVFEEMFPVLVTHMTSSYDVEEYAKEKGIALYYSYDF